MRGLGVEANIELPTRRVPKLARVRHRVKRAAHEVQLAHELGQTRLEDEGLGDIGERRGAPQRDFAGMRAGLTDDEGGGGFGGGQRGGIALDEIRRVVRVGPLAGAGEVPRAIVDEFAVGFFPRSRGGGRGDERHLGAGDNRDVGAANDFEKAERVMHLLIAPMVARRHTDAENLDVG